MDQIRTRFFNLYPDPESAIDADSIEMAETISILGFKNRRTQTIKRFSQDWIEKDWKNPIELYGIGKYGQDSWEIFQLGNLKVIPTDGALISYLKKINK